MTNALAYWAALDCRPIAVVEDKGLEKILQIALSDPMYELPCRKTVTKRVQQLYDSEKGEKENLLKKAECVAITGDHWTSVSNANYLGVTAHFIDNKWCLHSFALTIKKITTRHFAENVAEDFESVTEAWEITQKVTTIRTDSALVLTALRHLTRTMKASDDDPAYVVKFKAAFEKDLSQREDALNYRFLQVATALDPRFKDLKCLPRGERGEVWTSIEALVQQQPGRATPERTEEPARKRSLLLYNSDSDSEDEDGPKGALARYKAEPTISERDCPLQWWSTHERAHPQLSVLARKYLGSPATSVPCERLFSLAGNIVQKKRAALSSENVNRLVCLSNWLKERK
ncbi:uncharacterized protein LOC118559130 [Fundulus heteroclitus]|uniref:uncharacterized protein LOC118559130 n=2 Tax=Fundulus heteroclitus TaxID=8078 RepID=UPI00165A9362|nr:uncharacterized protein LOC118559130 [Fundulus heteroclitus]